MWSWSYAPRPSMRPSPSMPARCPAASANDSIEVGIPSGRCATPRPTSLVRPRRDRWGGTRFAHASMRHPMRQPEAAGSAPFAASHHEGAFLGLRATRRQRDYEAERTLRSPPHSQWEPGSFDSSARCSHAASSGIWECGCGLADSARGAPGRAIRARGQAELTLTHR